MKSGVVQSVYCSIFGIVFVFAAATACHAGQKQPLRKNTTSFPAPVKAATKVAVLVYECPDCHDRFTLAQAKKAGFKCECCQTKLVSIKQPTQQPAKPSLKPSKAAAPQMRKG